MVIYFQLYSTLQNLRLRCTKFVTHNTSLNLPYKVYLFFVWLTFIVLRSNYSTPFSIMVWRELCDFSFLHTQHPNPEFRWDSVFYCAQGKLFYKYMTPAWLKTDETFCVVECVNILFLCEFSMVKLASCWVVQDPNWCLKYHSTLPTTICWCVHIEISIQTHLHLWLPLAWNVYVL